MRVRLSYRDWGGAGPPVVLLHGLAGHRGEWASIGDALSARFRVVALDQRGHGGSETHPADVSRAACVADVVAVIDELGLRRPVLAGQSLGGHTALLTAAARPDLVAGLVLVEAGPGPAPVGSARRFGEWLDSWPVPFPSRQAAVEFFGGGPVGHGWADGLVAGAAGLRPSFARDVLVRMLAEHEGRAYWPEWAAVVCPVLVVLARTGILAAADVAAMVRKPGVSAVSVPGSGHDVHLERPEAIRAVIEEFLATLG